MSTCIFGTVIFATYEADLTTRMTISLEPTIPKSFSDIATSNEYKVMTYAGGSSLQALRNAEDGSALRKIYEQVNSDREEFLFGVTCDDQCRQRKMKVSRAPKKS